jgi:hypothetical protein
MPDSAVILGIINNQTPIIMNNSTTTIDFQNIFLKTVSAVLFMLAFYSITAAQTTYTFTGERDDRYENAENWIPAYPGTEIAANSLVIIEGIAVSAEALTVNGTLHIATGASLEMTSANLSIRATGKLMNDGELFAATVYNAGMVNNNFAATLDAKGYTAAQGSMTNNLLSAEMIIRGDLTNGGVFNNYSTCAVEGDFINAFSFYALRHSEMKVAGRQIEQTGIGTDVQLTLNAR